MSAIAIQESLELPFEVPIPTDPKTPVLRRELSRLRALEAESIHILREAAAQFERPLFLYSIGKDSSVMLHLARGLFPGKYPIPVDAYRHRL